MLKNNNLSYTSQNHSSVTTQVHAHAEYPPRKPCHIYIVEVLMGALNWASGLIPLGRLHLRPLQRHFHSLGLTNWFAPPLRLDPVVLATLLRQWQDLSFLTSGIPIQHFQAEFTIFTDASTQGWGAHMGDSVTNNPNNSYDSWDLV